jgi:hypothetical protein
LISAAAIYAIGIVVRRIPVVVIRLAISQAEEITLCIRIPKGRIYSWVAILTTAYRPTVGAVKPPRAITPSAASIDWIGHKVVTA